MKTNSGQMRLDASEGMWLKRELEWVDGEIYKEIYAENIARNLIATQSDIPDYASVYTWSEMTEYGKAKIIANMSDDIPRVGASRKEYSKAIKTIADAYGWNIFDIKRAAKNNMHLDTELAQVARRMIETEIDRILSLGDTANNLDGMLKLDANALYSITPTVAITKTGGGTNWSTAATPNEIAGDVIKLLTAILTKLQGTQNTPAFRKFRIVMPDANFLKITQLKMGDYDARTVYQYLLENPYVESIVGWYRAVGAAANNTDDRIMAFAPDKMVLSGIVPMEFSPQDAEKRNLEYVVDCVARCGGVVSKYPVAIGYMDTIDVP